MSATQHQQKAREQLARAMAYSMTGASVLRGSPARRCKMLGGNDERPPGPGPRGRGALI